MAVQLNGQTTWDAKAKEQREATAKALYDAHKLRTDDTVRFTVRGKTTKIEGRPIAANADGSVNVATTVGIRAVLPERLEVKMTGPRGGTVWERLVPEEVT